MRSRFQSLIGTLAAGRDSSRRRDAQGVSIPHRYSSSPDGGAVTWSDPETRFQSLIGTLAAGRGGRWCAPPCGFQSLIGTLAAPKGGPGRPSVPWFQSLIGTLAALLDHFRDRCPQHPVSIPHRYSSSTYGIDFYRKGSFMFQSLIGTLAADPYVRASLVGPILFQSLIGTLAAADALRRAAFTAGVQSLIGTLAASRWAGARWPPAQFQSLIGTLAAPFAERIKANTTALFQSLIGTLAAPPTGHAQSRVRAQVSIPHRYSSSAVVRSMTPVDEWSFNPS